MKTYLTNNPDTELGYELICVADDGTTTHHPEYVKELNKDNYFHLDPSNPSGREWVAKSRFDKANGNLELVSREKRTLTTKSTTQTPTSKGWTQYLTEDELKVIQELKEKAIKRMKANKIRTQIEALQKMLNEEE